MSRKKQRTEKRELPPNFNYPHRWSPWLDAVRGPLVETYPVLKTERYRWKHNNSTTRNGAFSITFKIGLGKEERLENNGQELVTALAREGHELHPVIVGGLNGQFVQPGTSAPMLGENREPTQMAGFMPAWRLQKYERHSLATYSIEVQLPGWILHVTEQPGSYRRYGFWNGRQKLEAVVQSYPTREDSMRSKNIVMVLTLLSQPSSIQPGCVRFPGAVLLLDSDFVDNLHAIHGQIQRMLAPSFEENGSNFFLYGFHREDRRSDRPNEDQVFDMGSLKQAKIDSDEKVSVKIPIKQQHLDAFGPPAASQDGPPEDGPPDESGEDEPDVEEPSEPPSESVAEA